MDGDRQNPWLIPEDLLRSVAVVGVPIDDCYPIQSVDSARMLSRDSDVVEDAEAKALVDAAVMARRPDQRVSIVDFTADDSIDSSDRASSSESHDLEATRADRRLITSHAASVGADLLNVLYVR